MTTPSHPTGQGPGNGLSAPESLQNPDSGTERRPGGEFGPQTGIQRLRRLRGQLAAEHAKAVAVDQQPRPDLDHLRVTAPNGIAAGLEIAIFFADHHLREAGEVAELGAVPCEKCSPAAGETEPNNAIDWPEIELRTAQSGVDTPGCDCGHGGMGVGWHGTDCAWRARTTPDNSAASSDAADNPLREQHATLAAMFRDQATLAQVRLLIAAYRPRLKLADPILLTKLDRVLEQPAELEPAQAGER